MAAACSGSEQRALELAARAQAEAESGDLPTARKTIAQAIAERDDLPALYMEKARLALRAEAYVDAYRAYSDALTLDAANLEAHLMVAQLALALARHDEAEEAAQRVLLLQPGQPDARFILGMAQLGRRDFDAADQQASEILGASPRDERGLVLKARVTFARGQADKAIELIQTGSDPATRSPLLSRTLVELFRETGRAELMLAELSRMIARDPDDLDSRIGQVNILYRTGRTAQARRAARELLARPELPPAVLARLVSLWEDHDRDPLAGSTTVRIGDDKARMALARFYLLGDQPQHALALLHGLATPAADALRWRIAMGEKPTARGLEAIEDILDDDATQCDALLARAAHLRARGRPDEAIRDARRAVAECPNDPAGTIELARTYRGRNDLPAELRAFEKGLEANAQSVPLTRAALRRMIEAKEPERARAVARRLTRAAPSKPAGWTMLMEACAAAGDAPCRDAAQAGLVKARASLGIDPLPGEVNRPGALGRLQS